MSRGVKDQPHNAELKPKPADPDRSQLDRFKQTARELGCDETGETFERVFAKAIPPKDRKKPTKI